MDTVGAMADQLVGVSPWTHTIRREIARVGATDSVVLITGPSGTGKELIAHAIHEHSPRAARPFIPVDCTCFVRDLFPSHMFGHVRGAFTGACCESLGCFRAADGGTIFLDEIGELEPPLQAKLLRVLEERVVVPVGGVEPTPVDVRIVVATNRDLRDEVEAGRFREDLYYRLHVVELKTLPLNQRCEDIGVLARHVLAGLCHERDLPAKSLAPATLAWLTGYDWPGNVRELRNVLERALVSSDGGVITPETLRSLLGSQKATGPICRNGPEGASHKLDLSPFSASPANDDTCLPPPGESGQRLVMPAVSSAGACDPDARPPGWLTLDELQREHIRRALRHTGDNQTAAAKLLGITTRVLSATPQSA